MKVYGAGLLSSAAELQFVMDGAKVKGSNLVFLLNFFFWLSQGTSP